MTGAGRRLAAVLLVAFLLPLDGGSGPGASGPVASLAAGNATPSADTSSRISRVYAAAPRGDEFVEVRNSGTAAADLGGWALSDLEGTARFPSGTRLDPGTALVATRNATSYAEDVLRDADLTWDEGDATRMEGTGLRLADDGDEVFLLDADGRIVDAYVYGSSGYAGPGWAGRPATAPGRGEIAVRRGVPGVLDRDEAADWEGVRPFRLGQSAFEPPPVTLDGPVRAFVSPDDGAAPLLSFLASARDSVDVAVYTLTSESVGAVLADAARRGVRVRVLLEASPVGGLDDRERRIAGALAASGASVRWLTSGADVVKRYAYLHAKYALVDGEGVLVSSENFGSAGFPEDGGGGNRGWSVAVGDPQLASQLRDVFDEDFDPVRRDTVPAVSGLSGDLGPLPSVAAWTWPAATCCRTAQLLLGPDNVLGAGTLLALFEGARERIWIEAFYLEDPWGPWANPLLDAAYRAASRGVEVRLLLDGGTWHSGEDPGGNEAVAAAVNARALAEGWSVEARLLPPRGAVGTLHNKGVLVDGRFAVVSSVNWARGSATENREVGLILDDPAVAARFEAAYREDWGDPAVGSASGILADPLALLGLYAFVAGASALSLRFLRPGDKGLRSRAGLKPRGPGRAPLRGRRREVRLLPAELVAEPRARPRGGRGDRRGREEARGRLRGPEGDRG